MKSKIKAEEIYLGTGNNLLIHSTQLVSLRETLVLMDTNKEPIELDVKIEADFSTIPEQYHEVFLNMMTVKYYNKVSFGDNPFSQCLSPGKKKWWQFWRSK